MFCSSRPRRTVPSCASAFSLIAGFLVAGVMIPSANAQYWGPSYHSSTAGESHARGLGALIRDQGAANLLNAEAASTFEDARSKAIANSVDAVEAYYDRKRVHDEFYAEKKKVRQARSDHYLARRGGLPELSEYDIDVTTGGVNWPSLLQVEAYNDYRAEYEQIIKDYFTNGTLSGEQFMKSQSISRTWRKQIGIDRKKYGVDQAREAVRFVLALDKVIAGT